MAAAPQNRLFESPAHEIVCYWLLDLPWLLVLIVLVILLLIHICVTRRTICESEGEEGQKFCCFKRVYARKRDLMEEFVAQN
jgi:hypothetical protein